MPDTDTLTPIDELITDDMVAAYQRDGFIKVPGIIRPEEVARFYEASLDETEHTDTRKAPAFDQTVNVWRHNETLRELTLHPRVAAAATKLATVPLRLWHDHLLIKWPHKSTPTHFHQDQAYWPHANSLQPISAWIALCDVPVEKGCMTFLPGSHRFTDLPTQNLNDPESLFGLQPELRWWPRVTLPLRAGDCTFHHGRTGHAATPNTTDEPRVAHVIIYIDQTTTLNPHRAHLVTDPLGLEDGDLLEGDMFPKV